MAYAARLLALSLGAALSGASGCSYGYDSLPSTGADLSAAGVGGVSSSSTSGGTTSGGTTSGGTTSGGTTSGGASAAGGSATGGMMGTAGMPSVGGSGGAATGGSASGGGPADQCASYPSAWLCTGLETPLPSGADSVVVFQGGTVSTVSSPVRSGASSLQATLASSQTLSSARITKNFSPVLESTDFYGKLWLYVPAATTITDFSPLVLHHSSLAGGKQLSLGVNASGLIRVYSQGVAYVSAITLPRDRWMCLVLYAKIANQANAGQIRLDLDGATIVNQAAVDTYPNGGYSLAFLGADGTGVGAVYLDDIVLSPTVLTCP